MSPTTASTLGTARDVLSDEDPDDPLIAERRAEARRESQAAYRKARAAMEDATEASFAEPLIRIGWAVAVPQMFIMAAAVFAGAIPGPVATTVFTIGSYATAAAELMVARPFRRMRDALRNSPSEPADLLAYELHRAEAVTKWVKRTWARMLFGRRVAQWRATRAVHRTIDRAIAGLGDPETDATARLVLPKAVGLLDGLELSRLLYWRTERRHCNALFRLAQRSGDPAVTNALYHELAVVANRSYERLQHELGFPIRFLPLRARLAMRIRDGKERVWSHAAWARLPKFLRGERTYARRVFRQARRVQTLTEAQCRIHRELGSTLRAPLDTGSDGAISAELAAVNRVAEMRVLRYRLGDRSVDRRDLVADARRVAFLAGVLPGDPARVLEENAARMESVGIRPEEIRNPDLATVAAREPAHGDGPKHASPERIRNVFARATRARSDSGATGIGRAM